MQSATVGSRPDRATAAVAFVLAATGLALVAVGGAVLTRGSIDLLDGDVRWGSLLVGSAATATGAIVFFRSSRAWASGGTPARTSASRAGRIGAAIAAVAIGVVAFAAIGGAIAGSLAGQPFFESSCSEMDSILCGMQGALGAGLAGLLLGIRAAGSVLRGRWAAFVVLTTLAAVESVVLVLNSA